MTSHPHYALLVPTSMGVRLTPPGGQPAHLGGSFTLQATRCLGACGLAPVMTVNDEVYGRLTPDAIPDIIAKYRKPEEA